MESIAIIPASGSCQRWRDQGLPPGVPRTKQLLPLPGGQIIIGRHLAQWARAGIKTAVISNNPDLCDVMPCIRQPAEPEPKPRAWMIPGHTEHLTATTMLSSQNLWADRTWIVFGDIVWSREAFEKVSRPSKPWMVYGFHGGSGDKRWSEFYGFYFDRDHHAAMCDVIKYGIAWMDLPPKTRPHTQYPMMLRAMQLGCAHENIDDWSFDVDFYPAYLELCKEVEKHEGVKTLD